MCTAHKHIAVIRLNAGIFCLCIGMYRQCDSRTSLILGVLGILPERLVGEELAADFLLFHLNRRRQFDYVHVLGLNSPTNDIHEAGTRHTNSIVSL